MGGVGSRGAVAVTRVVDAARRSNVAASTATSTRKPRDPIATAPSLELYAPSWRVGLGATGVALSDLTGMNASGRGASVELTRARWGASAVYATPDYSGSRSAGAIRGGRVQAQLGTATLSASATHLADSYFESRRLDAFGFGASSAGILNGVLAGGLAQRRYAGREGLGWLATYERQATRDNVSVRVAHMPGGADAYARYTDEFAAHVGRRLGRVALNGSAWRNSDPATGTFRSMASQGWSAGSQLAVTSNWSVGVQAHGSQFSAASAVGSLKSGDDGFDANVSGRVGQLYGTASSSVVRIARETGAGIGMELAEAALQSRFRATIGTSNAHGRFEATGSMDQSGRGAGLLPRQAVFGARAQEVPLFARGAIRATANAGVQRYSWFGARQAANAVQLGTTAHLPGDLAVTVSAERNPFFIPVAGDSRWMTTLRLERVLGLPRLRGASSRGLGGAVFEDVNANGVRDAAEAGVAGVVIRAGSVTAVSDRDGKFRVAAERGDSVEVDARSLPMGWVGGARRAGRDGMALALTSLSPVSVRLVVPEADKSRLPASELEKIVLVARDSAGRAWVARSAGQGTMTFDALPVGQYTLEMSTADLAEPVRAQGELPRVVVDQDHAAQDVTIRVRPRTMKVRVLDAAKRPAEEPPACGEASRAGGQN